MFKAIFSWKFIFLCLIIGGAVGYWQWSKQAEQPVVSANENLDRYYEVTKGPMQVSLLQSGTLESSKNYKLGFEAPLRTTLVWIVDEGSQVKKEDVIIKFDDEDLKNRIIELTEEVESKAKSLLVAEEELDILKTANAAKIRRAEDAVDTALEAFQKYRKLEGPKERDSQRSQVESKEQALEDKRLAHQEKLDEIDSTVFDNADAEETAKRELERLASEIDEAETAYANQITDYKIYKRYTARNKIQELENQLEQKRLDLKETQVTTASNLLQKESTIETQRRSLKRSREQLEEQQGYLKDMQVASPVDGVVIYGDPTSRRHNLEISVGMNVNKGQTLITIPDMSTLIVNYELPEQYRSRVKVGNDVIVTPDSIPNLKLKGRIKSIDSLPVHQIFWDKTSPKIYRSQIELFDNNERLVSGMNVQIEIVTQRLENVLSVPVESVFEENGKFCVFRKTLMGPERAVVKLGVSDDHKVHVIEGLEDGDEIFLYRPFSSAGE